MEYVFIILVGGTFVYGFIHWMNNITSTNYTEHVKGTILAFIVIMTGTLFVYPSKISFIINNIFSTINPLWVIGTIAVFFPASIYIFTLKSFDTVFEAFENKNWFISFLMIILGMAIISFKVPYKEIIIFLALMPTIGFLHGVLGSLIASFNISLFLTYIFKQQALNIDINTVFDFFSFINITDPTMKWAILFISTFLGLSTMIENIINKNNIY
jgi:hypothetical protein